MLRFAYTIITLYESQCTPLSLVEHGFSGDCQIAFQPHLVSRLATIGPLQVILLRSTVVTYLF
jgi:hypothetical protein